MNIPYKPFPLSEPMDQDNNRAASEQRSRHAVRQRCLSALAAVSTQASVVQESTPVLLEVLSSAHTGKSVRINGLLTSDIDSVCLIWLVEVSRLHKLSEKNSRSCVEMTQHLDHSLSQTVKICSLLMWFEDFLVSHLKEVTISPY